MAAVVFWLLCSWFFSRPVTGLLGRPAAFRVILSVYIDRDYCFCLLSVAAVFFGEVGFVSGTVTGLLGRAGDFSEVRFVVGLRICLLCLNATFLVQLDFVQGLSLACLVGLLLVVKWDFSRGLLVCLLRVAAAFFFV